MIPKKQGNNFAWWQDEVIRKIILGAAVLVAVFGICMAYSGLTR